MVIQLIEYARSVIQLAKLASIPPTDAQHAVLMPFDWTIHASSIVL